MRPLRRLRVIIQCHRHDTGVISMSVAVVCHGSLQQGSVQRRLDVCMVLKTNTNDAMGIVFNRFKAEGLEK